MAREYGRIFTRIWADPEFRALGRNAQHLYFQLVSQPDLSMAGVVTLAPLRWAMQAQIEEDDVMDSLATLCDPTASGRHFTYVDLATQEVLLRSYVRVDNGWKSPTTMKAVASAMESVLSLGLKSVLSGELDRLDTSTLSKSISEKTGRSTYDVVMGYIEAFQQSVIPHPEPSPIPHRIPHAIGHPIPHPMGINEFRHEDGTEPEPEPEPTIGDGDEYEDEANASSPATPSRVREPNRFDEFWDSYPRKVGKDDARNAYQAARKRADQQTIIDGCVRLASDPNLPEKNFIPHPATWLRQGRWQDEPLPPRRDGPRGQPSQRVATADQRLMDGMALSHRLAAEESQTRTRMELGA